MWYTGEYVINKQDAELVRNRRSVASAILDSSKVSVKKNFNLILTFNSISLFLLNSWNFCSVFSFFCFLVLHCVLLTMDDDISRKETTHV